jgi:hypothetical protein
MDVSVHLHQSKSKSLIVDEVIYFSSIKRALSVREEGWFTEYSQGTGVSSFGIN